jgi:hypothetical protein
MLPNTTIIIEVIVVATLLFVLINYFINSSYEINAINEIIKYKSRPKSDDEEVDENKIYYDLEILKAKYLKQRFRVYMTRGIIFGLGLWFIISYFMPQEKKVYNPFIYRPEETSNTMNKNEPKIFLDDKLQARNFNAFFDHPPW